MRFDAASDSEMLGERRGEERKNIGSAPSFVLLHTSWFWPLIGWTSGPGEQALSPLCRNRVKRIVGIGDGLLSCGGFTCQFTRGRVRVLACIHIVSLPPCLRQSPLPDLPPF